MWRLDGYQDLGLVVDSVGVQGLLREESQRVAGFPYIVGRPI